MNDIVKEAVSASGMLDSESELWGSVILRQMKGDSDIQAMITIRKKIPARTSNQLFFKCVRGSIYRHILDESRRER